MAEPLCPVTIVSLVSSVSKPLPGMLTVAGYRTSMRMLASAGSVRVSYGTAIRAMMPFGPHVAPEGIVVDVVVVGTLVVVVGRIGVVGVGGGTGGVGVGAPGSRSVTTSSTKASTRASTADVSAKVGHGVSDPAGYFASSFAKQPFVGSSPPSNFALTLSMQALSL